jgi:hypothetical protein
VLFFLGTIRARLEHLWNKTPYFGDDFQKVTGIKAIESSGILERAMGIEPTSEAWEARNITLKAIDLRHLAPRVRALVGNWKESG